MPGGRGDGRRRAVRGAGRRAIADGVAASPAALAVHSGELLPLDRYEPWAQERRDQIRLRLLGLLRLDGAWEALVELDDTDEVAHLALMRRRIANGDRRAGCGSSNASRGRCGTSSASDRAGRHWRCATRWSGDRRPRPQRLLGRDQEPALLTRVLRKATAGRGRAVVVNGVAGIGKTAMRPPSPRARELGVRVGSGRRGGRGRLALRAGAGGAGAGVPRDVPTCRRARRRTPRGDRARCVGGGVPLGRRRLQSLRRRR